MRGSWFRFGRRIIVAFTSFLSLSNLETMDGSTRKPARRWLFHSRVEALGGPARRNLICRRRAYNRERRKSCSEAAEAQERQMIHSVTALALML